MLKFLHIARISNFRTFLTDFGPDFKHVVLCHVDELLALPYKLESLRCLVSIPT
jgi:hypothetical protein